MQTVVLGLNTILQLSPNSQQMDNISFKPLMLGHNKVISSAYDKAPIYVLFKKQPTPDSFNLINNLSIYSVKRTGDKTPPLFYPIG